MSQPAEVLTKRPWYRRKQVIVPVVAGTALLLAAGGTLIGFQAAYGSLKQNQNYAVSAIATAQEEATALEGTAAELTGKSLTGYQAHLETIAKAPALIGKKEAATLTEAKGQLGDPETATAVTFAVDMQALGAEFEWVTPARYSDAQTALTTANEVRADAESARDAQQKLVKISAEQITSSGEALVPAAKNALKNVTAVQESSAQATQDTKDATAKAVDRVKKTLSEHADADGDVAAARATLALGAATAALVDAQAALVASHAAEVAAAEAAAQAAADAEAAAAAAAAAVVPDYSAPAPYSGGDTAQNWGGGGGGWNTPAPDPTPAPVTPPTGSGGGGGSYAPPPPGPNRGNDGCPPGANCYL